MAIIELLSGLIVGGLVLAGLKNLLKGHGDRLDSLHMN